MIWDGWSWDMIYELRLQRTYLFLYILEVAE